MLPHVSMECAVVEEPSLRFSAGGKAWLRLRVVAKDRVRGANGAWEDGDACFIGIVAFGKVAENITETVTKGTSLVVEGRLKMNQWTDESGTKRTDYEVVADQVGISLKWKAYREFDVSSPASGSTQDDPWASTPVAHDEPPF